MLNVSDLMARYEVPRVTLANWYARRVLPDAITIGGELHWREEDIELFDNYLALRQQCREEGIDPDSADGPAPPIYSTGCESIDPRKIVARIRERERRQKSKTLAAGSPSIPAQSPVELPTVNNQEQGQTQ